MTTDLLDKPVTGAKGGGKSGGSGGRTASEDPNTLKSNSVARILDLISEGPIVGLVAGEQSIIFDDTQLADNTGKENFSGVSWDQRYGLPDQPYMAGFADAETTLVVNLQVLHSAAVVRTINGPVDAARITLNLPALTEQDPKTGDLHGSTVQVEIAKRHIGAGSWTVDRTVTITGKCVSAWQSSYRVELGGATDWEMRLTRLTADSAAVNLQNQTWWASTALITDGKFQYPNSAYIGLNVDAQQFGSSIPARAYDVKGRIVQVPVNYDPVTRVYTGLWNGTFKTAWTDNPAWVAYDLLTHPRYGLGNFVGATEIDKWSLYAIAQYCDELVPDGFGGMEPRYTFNYQITGIDDAIKIIQSVASNFRGMTYWASGRVFFVADMPQDPVALITPSNVKGGLFTYEGVALSARHSVCMVTWFDPADRCRQAIELVEDPDLIALYGWRPLTLAAYGCTSRGQAHRTGKWALDSERYATETVHFDVAWDQAMLAPGDVFELYDPDYQGLRLGGRVAGADSHTITVDAPLMIESGKTYTLKLVLLDGTLASRPLTNAAGTTDTLAFTTALTTLPIVGAVWAVSISDLKPRQFRVMSVKETGDGTLTVSALQYDPTKYARVEQDIKLDPVAYTRLVGSRPDAPLDLAVQEYVYRYNADLRSAATISWTPPGDTALIQSYDIERQRPNGNWEVLGNTSATSIDALNCDVGDWNFRVRAVNYNGLASTWFSKTVSLFGMAAAPADVTGFAMHALGDTATLSWNPNTELDISHYRIKFAPMITGATWAAAVDLLPIAAGISVQVPVMIGTYLIKAVDLSGTESTNAAQAATTIAAVAGFNAVVASSDWPTWGGTHSGTVASGGLLKLSAGNTTGTYSFASATDLGAVYTSRLSASIDAYGQNVGNTWASLGAWSTVGPWATVAPNTWNVRLQLQVTQNNPASGTAVWSAWTDLVVGDYTARGFRFRLLLSSTDANVLAVVNDATAIIDMPDRRESANSLSSPTGGLAVSFVPPFRATPAVGITCQNQQSGDSFQYLSGPTASGFTIKFLDKNGVAAARTFDYLADGFGRAS